MCSRNVFGAQEVDHPRRRHPLGPAQQPVADDLERVSLPVPEEPVHHAGVAEGGREPLVRSFHVEPPVELLRLELDVPEREGAREAREQVLLADLQLRTHGIHQRDQAVEAVVALGPMSLRVGGLLVVPVVERADLESLPEAPHHVLDPTAVSLLEQGEGFPHRVEWVVDREVEALTEGEGTHLPLPLELQLVLVVDETGCRQDEHEDQQQRRRFTHVRSIDPYGRGPKAGRAQDIADGQRAGP